MSQQRRAYGSQVHMLARAPPTHDYHCCRLLAASLRAVHLPEMQRRAKVAQQTEQLLALMKRDGLTHRTKRDGTPETSVATIQRPRCLGGRSDGMKC